MYRSLKNPHAKPQGFNFKTFLSYGLKYVLSVLVSSITLALIFDLSFWNLKHITLRYVPTPNKNVLTSGFQETAVTKNFSTSDSERHRKKTTKNR